MRQPRKRIIMILTVPASKGAEMKGAPGAMNSFSTGKCGIGRTQKKRHGGRLGTSRSSVVRTLVAKCVASGVKSMAGESWRESMLVDAITVRT